MQKNGNSAQPTGGAGKGDTTASGGESAELMNNSATKIQAGVRGFLVRKRQKQEKESTAKQ